MYETYENFEDLAEKMTGSDFLHIFNCPEDKESYLKDASPCILWQKGVQDFAQWLDHIGVEVSEIDNRGEDFYDFVSKERKEEE